MNHSALLPAAALALISAVPAFAEGELAPHRAVYDIGLDEASDRSGITGAEGRMVYEFKGSSCEGYTVNFRFVTRLATDETARLTDQQTATHEEGAGDFFTFATKSYVDGQLDQEVRGTATVEADETVVELVRPVSRRISLPRTLFPTQHMYDLLERADRGETFFETTIFDGSDSGDEVMATTVVIGKPETLTAGDAEAPALGALGDQRFRPVSVAYFDTSEERGEGLPVYRVAFKLYANGVTRAIQMDYGDFSLTGTLVDLEMYESTDCR
jgi:hypothetical protein